MRGGRSRAYFLAVTIMPGVFAPAARCQQMSNFDRNRVLEMLDTVSKDVRKHYYDPGLHGMDWDARVSEAKNEIKQPITLGKAFAYVQWVLDGLNDSHTFFLPPQRPMRHDYGFQTAMIGDHCYITQVRPGSDAEAKRVKLGDEVVAIEGLVPNRQILWKMNFRFRVLRPQTELHVALRDPQGRQREAVVTAKIRELKRVTDLTGGGGASDIWDLIRDSETEEQLMRMRATPVGDELMVVKLPEFFFDAPTVDGLIDKARKYQSLIVDLRGNPGGAIETLKYLLGGIFDHEVKIGDRVGRKELKPETAKPRGRKNFEGKIIVLVDSQSASASELFARIVQIEKRGVVLGDASSGSVMEAKHFDYHMGTDTWIFYGASITESDLVMTDGKSLEHTGVTPDEVILPSATDLASGRDPVLAHAAALLGAKLTSEDAGKMFPYEWPEE